MISGVARAGALLNSARICGFRAGMSQESESIQRSGWAILRGGMPCFPSVHLADERKQRAEQTIGVAARWGYSLRSLCWSIVVL